MDHVPSCLWGAGLLLPGEAVVVLDIDDLVSLRDAAALLGTTYDGVWQLLRADVLKGYRCAGQWFVSRSQVSDYAAAQPRLCGEVPA
jgi:hypothetical protein